MKNLYCGKDTQLNEAVIKKEKKNYKKETQSATTLRSPRLQNLRLSHALKAYRNPFIRPRLSLKSTIHADCRITEGKGV